MKSSSASGIFKIYIQNQCPDRTLPLRLTTGCLQDHGNCLLEHYKTWSGVLNAMRGLTGILRRSPRYNRKAICARVVDDYDCVSTKADMVSTNKKANISALVIFIRTKTTKAQQMNNEFGRVIRFHGSNT